ncbi:phage antirepressor protein KilAC domain protein [Selenomonas sp. FOBRC9]|uniref:phage antirepressor KilAC domain-containing protein n=1 Tax=Selenomonas sp. FOBRC9 TaxID=936573 RepID=UPI00027A3DD2|nr:phage antirepressor KilAC domain-containing protein [Selenomonas sp. FOBRC9]EJP28304.1 phage antirepressor protein KilAC domain protein [Selenomonas sp. FOBRC9]
MTNAIALIFDNENGEVRISGRQLHMFLEVQTPYTKWFDRMTEYGFTENVDFNLDKNVQVQNEGGREVKRELIDHLMTLSMAKELAMLQRTDKGKEVRLYFIRVEEEWNTPERVMARALRFSERILSDTKALLTDAQKQIERDRPKVLFADSVSTSHTTILIGELAKIIKQNGVNMGQNRLFQWMRENGYLIGRRGTDYNMPTQKAMEMGLFTIKETAVSHADGHTSISKTPKVTGKGQVYFVNKFVAGV